MKRWNIFKHPDSEDIEDSKANASMDRAQSAYEASVNANAQAKAPSTSSSNLSRAESHHDANAETEEPHRPTSYVPWDQRSQYNNDAFFGDPSQPWSPQNTIGWEIQDKNNPYTEAYLNNQKNSANTQQNPQYAQRRPHKHHTIMWIVIVILVALVGWLGCSVHNANTQSAKPQQPRVIRKTVIDRQPNNNPQGNNQQGNQNNQNNQAQANLAHKYNVLQADMQNAKLNAQQQSQLINDYKNLSNTQKTYAYDMANWLDHLVPSNNIKRDVITKTLNTFGN